MTLRKGLPAKLALTDADDTRYDFSAVFVADTSGVPRAGVTSPVGVNVVTATGTMNVSVARFQGVAVRDGGVVLLANDGATNVLLDAAPASNSRLDVVYAKQNDASATVSAPDANNLPVFGVAKGTAGAVPVKPAIPAGALEIATVQIPSTATATNSSGVVITQSAPFTAAAGGVVPFRTKAELDLWATAAVNQRAFVLGDGVTYRFNGTSWRAWESDWIAYTATLGAGFALGTGGTQALKYRFENGSGRVRGPITLGTGFTIPSAPTITHPPVTVAALPHAYSRFPGNSSIFDASSAVNSQAVMVANNTSTTVAVINAITTNGAANTVNSTTPITFAAGDVFDIDYTFEPA